VKDNALYTIGFSALLGLVCAALLSAAGAFTRPYREANAKAEEMRRILEVLRAPVPAQADAGTLVKLFETNVRVEKNKKTGLTRYLYQPSGAPRPEAVAIAFSGQGLWGPIHGLIALEADMNTVRGITFTHQEETPGLGAEITSDWFRSQFAGKKVRDARGKVGIRIAHGRAPKKSATEVDGITGATLTCTKLQAMLNRALKREVSGER